MQVLLDPFEEQFDLPATLVQPGDEAEKGCSSVYLPEGLVGGLVGFCLPFPLMSTLFHAIELGLGEVNKTIENKGPEHLFRPSKLVAGIGFEPMTFRL